MQGVLVSIAHLHVALYRSLQCFHVCSCVRFFMKCIEAADMATPLIVCYSSSLARNYNRRCHTEQYFQYFLEFSSIFCILVSKSVFFKNSSENGKSIILFVSILICNIRPVGSLGK